MKLLTNTLLPVVSTSDLKKLTTQVEERLDIPQSKSGQTTFHRADLWNISRQRKTFITRRYLKA